MNKKEIEVKIELNLKEFKKFTKNIEYFQFERTYGYFKKDWSNIQKGIFPRIKYIKYNQHTEVIFGLKIKQNKNKHYFEREEMELKISDYNDLKILRNIVKRLDYTKEIIFEKKRYNIFYNDITISFDELPFGYFVEFEGNPKIIDQYITKYNLNNKPTIKKAYLKLWEEYKNSNSLTEENCIFK